MNTNIYNIENPNNVNMNTSNNDRQDKLNNIEIENNIWIIYLIIIALSYYSNYKEKDYLLNNNIQSKNEYQTLIIIIFSILVVIYYYFAKDSVDKVNNLNINDSQKKQDLTKLASVASILILISGIIFLIIAIKDENIDVELAFN